MSLKFFEATHTYELDGQPIDGVTTLLKYAGLVNDEWFTAESRQRGIYVHEACHLDDAGDLDEVNLDPVLQNYVTQYRAFKRENRIRIQFSEYRVFNREHWYAGTIDKYVIKSGKRVLVDLKSGGIGPVKEQLGGYSLALRERGHTVHAVAVLQLTEESYRYREFDRAVSEAEWLAALNKARVA